MILAGVEVGPHFGAFLEPLFRFDKELAITGRYRQVLSTMNQECIEAKRWPILNMSNKIVGTFGFSDNSHLEEPKIRKSND